MALTKTQLRRLRQLSPRTGNRVELARQMLNLTQEQIADALHMRQTYVSAVCRGEYGTVTVAKARKFARLFGCSIEDLFPEVELEAVAS
jgi:transcriptional regulator with XRE-family HTH domain